MLSEAERDVVETDVRAACDAGDFASATTAVVERYGPEILGYLLAVLRNETDTDDAFALFCENVWQGLPGFEWRSSLRTWLYALARSTIGRIARQPHRKPGRGVPLSQAKVAEMAEKVRTSTRAYLRTAFRQRVDELRSQLSSEDQTLLILRINRKMSWNEIAEVMSDEGLDGSERRRYAATLRKRFERTKASLREQARAKE